MIDYLKMDNLLQYCIHETRNSILLLPQTSTVEETLQIAFEKCMILLESIEKILMVIQLHLHKRHRDWIACKLFNEYQFVEDLSLIILDVLRFEYSLFLNRSENAAEIPNKIERLDSLVIRISSEIFETIRGIELKVQFKCYFFPVIC